MARIDEARDFLSDSRYVVALYWLPFAMIIVTGLLHVQPLLRTAVWVLSLTILGAACIANALRCGRTHCYFTGPFFLVMALLTLLFGLQVVALGERGWSTLSLAFVVGTVLLYYIPDAVFGRYRKRPGSS